MSTTPQPRRHSPGRIARAAAATGVVAALAAGCSMNLEDYTLPGGADVGENPMSVAVQFDDVLDLVVQSSVKVNGLDAGRVTGISLADDGWTAKVDVVLRDDVNLPANVEASIQQTNLLGEKFVQLTPPEGEAPEGRLADGDVITSSNTRTATAIEQVLGALSLLLNGGGVDRIQPIVKEMRSLTGGREAELTRSLRSADELITGLNRQRDSITAALDGVNLMTSRANDQREQIQAALDELPAGVAVLEEQRPQLVEMLRRVDALGEVGSDILLRSREDLIADLRALRPILQHLGEVAPEFIQLAGFVPTFPFPDASIESTVGNAANVFLSVDATISETLRNLGVNQGDPVPVMPVDPKGPYVVDPDNPWVGGNGPDRRTTIVAAAAASAAGHGPGRGAEERAGDGGLLGEVPAEAGGAGIPMNRLLRTQLIVFCVIAALGIVYVGGKYVRLPSLFGIGQYQVYLDLPDTGGVFTNAAVNYRGTPVGRVGALDLTDDGVRVTLDLDSSAPDIPADTVAVIANRSAIGEQYVDLRHAV